MTRSRYRIVDARYPHFLTATINHWLPVSTRPEAVEIVLDSWRFLWREAGFILYGYVILENHRHLVDHPEHRRYSSARDYSGQDGLIWFGETSGNLGFRRGGPRGAWETVGNHEVLRTVSATGTYHLGIPVTTAFVRIPHTTKSLSRQIPNPPAS